MDNLPKDPPDQNNNNSAPPSFGSGFNPHSNPVDPNNPYSSQPPQTPIPDPSNPPNSPNTTDPHPDSIHSEVAQHRPRDTHGHFLPYEHPANPQTPPAPQTAPTPPNLSTPSNPSSFLPPIIEVNQNTQPSSKKDPPLFGFFLTNPVTYLKLFLQRLIKRQAITLKIPVLAILIIMVGIGGFGVGFQSGINWSLARLFPNYSPILHRSITQQGIIQKNNKGEYFLKAEDKDKSMWTLRSVSANVNLEDYVGKQVQIKGNLTPTPNLIDVSEVISFDNKSTPAPTSSTNGLTSQTSPNTPNTLSIPNQDLLPKLYSDIKWETTQKKVLLFTSGKRRIEQEGVYLESAEVTDYPQAFLDYYTNQLTNSGFKQTFNSSEPNGTTITYAKDDLFLTFGVKNVYSGSGESKKIVDYKAFIEHN